MKRFVKGLCLMGVVALLATSCNKEKTNGKVYRAMMDPTEPTFVTENANTEFGERIYLDEMYRVYFEADDLIMVFNIDDEDATASEAALYKVTASGNECNLEPYQAGEEVGEMMDAKYAFYPGNNVMLNQLSNGNRGIFKLDPVQYYREEGGNPVIAKEALYMAAKQDNAENDVFAFRNICGILVMKFYSPAGKTVKSIAVTDPSMNLCGDVTMIVPEVDPVQMTTLFRNYDPEDPTYVAELAAYKQTVGYAVDASTNTLTLNCEENPVTLGTTIADANTFYFVLRPLALMNGYDMVITFSDNTTKTISSVRDNMIKPNTLRVFPALSVD